MIPSSNSINLTTCSEPELKEGDKVQPEFDCKDKQWEISFRATVCLSKRRSRVKRPHKDGELVSRESILASVARTKRCQYSLEREL